MQRVTYTTHGVCARAIDVDIENDIIVGMKFHGGCNGNTSGISSLVIGMTVEEVIKRLEGIKCGLKSTSCPDQLAKALIAYKNNK